MGVLNISFISVFVLSENVKVCLSHWGNTFKSTRFYKVLPVLCKKSLKKPSLCVCPCVCCWFLQEADIAVAPLTLTAKRETAVDMSKPFMQTGLSFILLKDLASDDSQFLSLLNLFSTEMWMGILVAYLLTSICIFFVSR